MISILPLMIISCMKLLYASILFVLIIKRENFFCSNEFYYGKVVPFVQTFVCQHPVYKWPKTFDLKHDPNIYMNMPIQVLKEELKKAPKILRTCRHNKHPIVMNPSYIDNFEQNKILGANKLKERADIVGSTRKIKKQKGTGTARAGRIKSGVFR